MCFLLSLSVEREPVNVLIRPTSVWLVQRPVAAVSCLCVVACLCVVEVLWISLACVPESSGRFSCFLLVCAGLRSHMLKFRLFGGDGRDWMAPGFRAVADDDEVLDRLQSFDEIIRKAIFVVAPRRGSRLWAAAFVWAIGKKGWWW